MIHSNANPRSAQYRTHARHCPGDMAVRMFKVLARSWVGVRVSDLLWLWMPCLLSVVEKQFLLGWALYPSTLFFTKSLDLKLRFVFSTRVIEAKLHWVDFSLLGRHFLDCHAIFLPHERLLKPKEQSLPFVCLRPHKGCGICPRDRLEITSR